MTRQEDAPWWASGAEGLGEEDPLTAHRRARGADGDEATSDGPEGTGAAAGSADPTPAWWEEASLALGALARAAGHVRPQADGAAADGEGDVHDATGELCDVCPVCVGLRVLERSRPEMVGHLTEALRHLTLAARSFGEAHGEQGPGRRADGGLERIDLDGE